MVVMRVGDEFTSEVNAKYAQVICKFSVKYSYFIVNIKHNLDKIVHLSENRSQIFLILMM